MWKWFWKNVDGRADSWRKAEREGRYKRTMACLSQRSSWLMSGSVRPHDRMTARWALNWSWAASARSSQASTGRWATQAARSSARVARLLLAILL